MTDVTRHEEVIVILAQPGLLALLIALGGFAGIATRLHKEPQWRLWYWDMSISWIPSSPKFIRGSLPLLSRTWDARPTEVQEVGLFDRRRASHLCWIIEASLRNSKVRDWLQPDECVAHLAGGFGSMVAFWKGPPRWLMDLLRLRQALGLAKFEARWEEPAPKFEDRWRYYTQGDDKIPNDTVLCTKCEQRLVQLYMFNCFCLLLKLFGRNRFRPVLKQRLEILLRLASHELCTKTNVTKRCSLICKNFHEHIAFRLHAWRSQYGYGFGCGAGGLRKAFAFRDISSSKTNISNRRPSLFVSRCSSW